ncbi:ATP synthase F1 subunit epsilon [Candidatus Nomurabacteria bacterium]|nr:ATP synthase F1 subunit epsilon [Candidatus Saccharibacteria bacterium]MCA9313401.1 ATP synthase F1 subunit epsilon [Candidatus Saccharibacteria bacterium]MCB9822435.1 ATP synthase F1 subunit epsilon [Candidatus Nomurabacteria bacterium]
MKFQIITLSGVKFSEEVYEIQLPTPDGQIGIFPHHMPLVSLAVPGLIAVRKNEKDSVEQMEYFATDGGVIEILDNTVRILADEAVHAEDIHEESSKKALIAAQEAYKNAKDKVSLDKAQAMIDRQAVRLNVAKYKRRRNR